jgi:hypothetical protein
MLGRVGQVSCKSFLSLLPDEDQVAWVLNCQPHDVPVLVAARVAASLIAGGFFVKHQPADMAS